MTNQKQLLSKSIPFLIHFHLIHYADIETIIINNKHFPYAIGWNDNFFFKYEYATNEEEIKNYTVIANFLHRISIHSNKKILLLFHNMSNFDGILFLNFLITKRNITPTIIDRENKIFEIKFSYNSNTIYIRDTLLILPMSLEKIGNTFSPIKKLDFNIEKINIYNFLLFKKKVIEYLTNDVFVLKNGIEHFKETIKQKFNFDITNSLSLSSISFNLFRKNFYDIKKTPIFKNNYEMDSYIRQSYIGGITDVYKPHLINGYTYDINSLYPYAMTKDLPIGKPKFIKSLHTTNISNFFGFVRANIIAPKNNNPFLAIKKDGQIITPTGYFTGTFFSEELKFAQSLGYDIMLLDGYMFKKGKPLKDYVTYLYSERQKYRKENPLNTIIKLLLNSFYGRFGMKLEYSKDIIIKTKEFNNFNNNNRVIFSKEIDENNIYVKYVKASSIQKAINNSSSSSFSDLEDFNVNTAVHIASAITSYARIHMHPYKNNTHCFYTDTDSIFTNKKFPSSQELGGMRLVDKVKEAYFISPKAYIYIDENNNKHVFFKGITDHIKNSLDINFFKKVVEEKNVKFSWKRITFFRKVFKDLNIIPQESLIISQIPFTKRIKIFDEKGIWIHTSPLNVSIPFEEY